jgi:hypothetical protein
VITPAITEEDVERSFAARPHGVPPLAAYSLVKVL